MGKWSRKKKETIARKAAERLAGEWRKCHAPDGKEKAVYASKAEAKIEIGGRTEFQHAYYCDAHQGWHVGHMEYHRPRMRVRKEVAHA